MVHDGEDVIRRRCILNNLATKFIYPAMDGNPEIDRVDALSRIIIQASDSLLSSTARLKPSATSLVHQKLS